MFLLAFHAFLRIGEITVRSKDNVNLIMLEKKITFDHLQSDQPFIVLRMTNFKHNASKQTVTLQIQSQKNVKFCPVHHLLKYLDMRGKAFGPLFCYKDFKAIQRTEFCKVLNAALNFSNYDTAFYKSHSFRIGAATTAHMLGFFDGRIKYMGRWHSDSYLRYVRVPMLSGLQI